MDFEQEINKLKKESKINSARYEILTKHVEKIETENKKLVHHVYHVSRAHYLRIKGLWMIENLDKTIFKYKGEWLKAFEAGDRDYEDFAKNYVFTEYKDGLINDND